MKKSIQIIFLVIVIIFALYMVHDLNIAEHGVVTNIGWTLILVCAGSGAWTFGEIVADILD